MSDQCGCGSHGPSVLDPSAAKTDPASWTVGEVARRPGALAVLERLRINHCCGAQLTLAEAAAAAGVPLAEVLSALDEAGRRA
jgi:iron-sulfur cluster repair protein YtfE (RIC family)